MTDAWEDRVPERLIEELQDSDEYVVFTAEWDELNALAQLAIVRDWLRRAIRSAQQAASHA